MKVDGNNIKLVFIYEILKKFTIKTEIKKKLQQRRALLGFQLEAISVKTNHILRSHIAEFSFLSHLLFCYLEAENRRSPYSFVQTSSFKTKGTKRESMAWVRPHAQNLRLLQAVTSLPLDPMATQCSSSHCQYRCTFSPPPAFLLWDDARLWVLPSSSHTCLVPGIYSSQHLGILFTSFVKWASLYTLSSVYMGSISWLQLIIHWGKKT